MGKHRRGGTLVLVVGSIVALCGVTALTVDVGRLYMEKQAAQNTADAGALAGACDLPDGTRATVSAQRAVTANGFSSPTITLLPSGSTRPSSIRVAVQRTVPLMFAAFVGKSSATVLGQASVTRVTTGNTMSGVVPLGVLPTDYQLGQVQSIKLGSQNDRVVSGNFQPLDLDGRGAEDYREWLKWGWEGTLKVGDVVSSETGNKIGPTNQALSTDTDSRFERAEVAPWDDDTWSSFDFGNPRIIRLPIIDWSGATKDGKAQVTILGFAAFYINDYNGQNITGSFVEYTDGTSVNFDPTLDPGYDGGVWISKMVD